MLLHRKERAETSGGAVVLDVISPDTDKYLDGNLTAEEYFELAADRALKVARNDVRQAIGADDTRSGWTRRAG
jgi:hypothetical protein